MFLDLESGNGSRIYRELIRSKQHRYIGKRYVFVGWNKTLLEEGNYFYGYSHIPLHKITVPANTFTITILRDPVQRVLSHFKMLKEEAQKQNPSSWFQFEKQYYAERIEEFVGRLPKQHLLNQIYMFSERFDIKKAADRIKRCNAWFFTDRFQNGVSRINSKLNLKLEPIHIRSSQIRCHLSQKEGAILRNALQPEYDLLTDLIGDSKRSHAI
jgi:hypothetical protein